MEICKHVCTHTSQVLNVHTCIYCMYMQLIVVCNVCGVGRPIVSGGGICG